MLRPMFTRVNDQRVVSETPNYKLERTVSGAARRQERTMERAVVDDALR
jgi:hypothetical protein